MEESIRSLFLSLGADVCGAANITAFENAPAGFHPRDLFDGCKSVVAFGVALPRGLAAVNPRLIYGHYNELSVRAADSVAFRAAKELEARFSCRAVPLPSDSPYEYWDTERSHGRGLLSMKHAAVLAGLGTLGKNTLLLNETFGNLLTLGAVLTELKLPSDPPAKSICIESCSLCLESCPTGALLSAPVDQSKCRSYTYAQNARGFDVVNCNRCRTVCPMRFGKKV